MKIASDGKKKNPRMGASGSSEVIPDQLQEGSHGTEESMTFQANNAAQVFKNAQVVLFL